MASFYNPYSPKPDVGQGMSDLIQQFIQMMLMKKIMQDKQQPQGGGQLQQNPLWSLQSQQFPQQQQGQGPSGMLPYLMQMMGR